MTLTLADEVDISRGDVLAAPDARPDVSDQFAAHLLWMARRRCCPAANICSSSAPARFRHRSPNLKHKVDVNTLDTLAAKTLALNEVGYCNISR